MLEYYIYEGEGEGRVSYRLLTLHVEEFDGLLNIPGNDPSQSGATPSHTQFTVCVCDMKTEGTTICTGVILTQHSCANTQLTSTAHIKEVASIPGSPSFHAKSMHMTFDPT